ncbi:MAG: tail fiber domain-containing protein [Phycisphaerales bacterium]|nr:MAG: tail fiber domain-containing protein [Phycisphaerales bacterium]
MRIADNGKVGIGTVDPQVNLHVMGGSDVTLTGGGYPGIGSPTGGNLWMDNNEITARNNGATSTLYLNNSGGDVVLCTSSGNVGIGSTSPDAALMTSTSEDFDGITIQTEDNLLSQGLRFRNSGSAYTWTVMREDAGSGEAALVFSGGPAGGSIPDLPERMRIAKSGNVGIGTAAPGFMLRVNGSAGKPGGGSWSSASDARLKTNVRDLEGSLDKVTALRGVTFEYKEPETINELSGEQAGMIAQEVEQVFPQWVDVGSDGYQRLTFRGFEAHTVEALRELREEKDAEIAALQDRIAKLESIIAKLGQQDAADSRR